MVSANTFLRPACTFLRHVEQGFSDEKKLCCRTGGMVTNRNEKGKGELFVEPDPELKGTGFLGWLR